MTDLLSESYNNLIGPSESRTNSQFSQIKTVHYFCNFIKSENMLFRSLSWLLLIYNEFCSEGGLTLETAAVKTLYDGQFTYWLSW